MIQQLERHARNRPDDAALMDRLADGPRRISWSMLLAGSASLAHRVSSCVPPGGVVLLICGNQAEFFPAYLGTLLADRVIFPLSPGLTAHELSLVIALAKPAMAIGGRRHLTRIPQGVSPMIAVEDLRWDDSTHVSRMLDTHHGDGAMWLMSSGTTGQPKIVIRSAAAVDAVGENCIHSVGYTPEDVLLTVTPLCHSYTIDHAMTASIISGAAVRITEGFDPAQVLGELSAGHVTQMPGIPFLYEAILALGDGVELNSKRRIKCLLSAGSPLPASVYEPFERRFGMKLGQIYGSTEFASVTFNDPRRPDFDPASVGLPMRGVSIRVHHGDAPVDYGEGEIVIASPSMFDGYVGQTDSPLQNGYLPSGDLGRVDARGRLFVTGRLNILIDVRGMKVNPLEVEAVLKAHPAIAEAVVVPVEVTATGNRIRAIVTRRAGETLDEMEVIAFARRHLSSYKVPRSIEVRQSLPRTSTGKVLRGALA